MTRACSTQCSGCLRAVRLHNTCSLRLKTSKKLLAFSHELACPLMRKNSSIQTKHREQPRRLSQTRREERGRRNTRRE